MSIRQTSSCFGSLTSVIKSNRPSNFKWYSTATTTTNDNNNKNASHFDLQKAIPYDKIPSPSKWEFLRGAMPGGKYHNKTLIEILESFQKDYGNVFRMPGLFGNKEIVMTMNPSDYETVFRHEGVWPTRRNFDSIVYYREVYRKDFFQGFQGIITTSGETWGKARSAVNPILMQPRNVRLYLNTMLEINDEFLTRIREIRDPATNEMPADFEKDINRLALGSVMAVALNANLGILRKNRDAPEIVQLMKSLRQVFELSFKLDILPPIWKVWKTPTFREMMKHLDILTQTMSRHIDIAKEKIAKNADGQIASQEGKEKSVLEKLLKIDKKLAVVMALDMMMAGVDTTSTTLVGILFCLSKNPEKQQLLLQEIKNILPEKDSKLTMENMANLPYLRACIKEGIRLYPIGPGTLRRTPYDIVISGYHVPPGVDVAVNSNLQCRDDHYVLRAKEFMPERWLRSNDKAEKHECAITNPFLYIPFGFGPRSCAGKRIVDLELEITVARLVRNFNIEFNYSVENAFKGNMFLMPAIPLKFKFEERNA